MHGFLEDVRYGLRTLKKSPGFAMVAVLTLALGIAVNTTVFSWIDAVLLHPFPGVGDAGSLALVETVTSNGEYLVNTSYIDYRDYRDSLKLVSGLAIGRFTPLSMGASGKPERAWAELVSANYFDVLQVKPVLGRAFLPEEGGDREHPVAVISHQLWQRRYQGDSQVLGRSIRLNRHELTIIGVAPPAFHGSTAGVLFDVWIPINMATAMGTGGGTLTFRGTRDITATIARLKPGVTREQARAEVAATAKRLAALYPATNQGVDATVLPLWAGHLGAQGLLLKPLRILLAVSLLLLLIVCANVANLLLARAVSRQEEFAIRIALGANHGRLARQLLTETLLLAGAGALAGVLLVMWMGQSLLFLLGPLDVPLDLGGGLNARTLGFTLLAAVASTLAAGTVPALLAGRADLNLTLKEGGRGGSSARSSHRLRGALVTSEVALALIALVGAGLFYRSFQNATGASPGFDPDNVSVSQFYLSSAGYSAREQHDFCRSLRARLESVQGVVGVSYSDFVPLASPVGTSPWHRVDIPGYVPAPGEQMMIHRATVSPGYFDMMRIPLLEGRDFTERDERGAPLVIIVNQTFARRYFAGANPLGRQIRLENSLLTVVGMAKDSKYHNAMEGPLPFFYCPFRQRFAPGLNFAVMVRTAGDPMRIVPTLEREALALNPDATCNSRLYTDAATASLYSQRVAATLLSVVGLVCLLLAAVGLYSVMSHTVGQRTHELGVRMALGARPLHVRGLVVREGLQLVAAGLAAGLAGAVIASRLVSGMLFQVSAVDPLTFLAAACLLAAVAAVASYVPAVRATRVDPMRALRCE